MKQMIVRTKDSKAFCAGSSLVSRVFSFKMSALRISTLRISNLRMLNLGLLSFLLVFVFMFALSISLFSNIIFADETNASTEQEADQETAQEIDKTKASAQGSDQNIETIKGIKSPQKVMLNGRDVEISAYNINDENYFKLRDIAALVADTNKSFDVFYNKEKNMIEITRNRKYQKIEGDLAPLADGKVEGVKSPQILEIDKKKEDVRAYNIMGNNYFRLRDLGEKLGIDVDFDIMDNKVLLVTERIAPKPVPKGEIKYIKEKDTDGTTAIKKIYPPEIENEPVRTCYPRAPKGQIVYDILERCHFNDKGEPVGPNGGKITQTYRGNLARRMGVDPFSFDLRRVETGSGGGSEDVIVGGSNG